MPAKDDKDEGHGNKGKEKGKHRETLYDYSEAPLHDGALRAQLQLAYESFQVCGLHSMHLSECTIFFMQIKYGTFSSIISSLGKEALELQLERFFTVWAWSWNVVESFPFSEYLGKLSLQNNHNLHVT